MITNTADIPRSLTTITVLNLLLSLSSQERNIKIRQINIKEFLTFRQNL